MLLAVTHTTPVALADDAPPVQTIVIHRNEAARLAALLERGREKMDLERDISGARRWLQPVAEAGSAEAARRIAETYDPVWLSKHGIVVIDGLADPAECLAWYRQAWDLGDREKGNRYAEGLAD